jgi:NitT/TauT family transport system substrate-binding protein
MNIRALFIGAILSVLILFGINGCESETQTSQQPETSGLPMKVGKAFWPGTYWVEIAYKKEWFKEAGLNVELIDTSEDYVGSLTDMVNGKLDANNFSLFDLMKFNVDGSDLVMVINADNSNGAEAILASSEIESLQALKGKNIGVSKGSYMEYILDAALDRVGVKETEVTLVNILSENAGDKINNGTVDAVVTYEPVVSKLLAGSDIRKLFDTSEIPGISPNGTAFHRSFIDQRPGDVQAFVNVWYRTTLFIKENPKQAFGIIAQIYDQTPGEVQAFAQMDKILDLRDNNVSFAFGSGFESMHGTARKINHFLIESGVTDRQLDSTDFLDARFLRTLLESSR